MKFKIKDNIKLQLLEELGFNYDGDLYSINYEDTYIFIDKETRLLDIGYLGDINNIKVINQEFTIKLSDPIILYTLIKLDLIEII